MNGRCGEAKMVAMNKTVSKKGLASIEDIGAAFSDAMSGAQQTNVNFMFSISNKMIIVILNSSVLYLLSIYTGQASFKLGSTAEGTARGKRTALVVEQTDRALHMFVFYFRGRGQLETSILSKLQAALM